MRTEDEWAEKAKRLLRTAMVQRGITYEGLSGRLATIGVEDSPVNLRNKVSRGKFTAVFMLQCLDAVGCKSMPLNDPWDEARPSHPVVAA